MKKCMACGNIGDDNSTVCEVCGKPYEDVAESTSEAAIDSEPQAKTDVREAVAGPGEAAVDNKREAEQEAPRQEQPRSPQGAQQPRRMRSGPQIYGQSGSAPQRPPYDQQGMVRRNMQGRPAGASQPQRAAGYQGQMPQGRPMNGSAPGMQARPASGQPVRQGRPGQSMGGRPGMQSPGQKARQVSAAARGMLRSPIFLVVALLNTLYLAGSIAAIFMGQLNFSQYARVIQAVELPSQVSGYVSSAVSLLSKMDSGMVVANLALKIPNLLFCIGLWLVFIMAARAEDRMSGIGFGFMKADIIINMIVSCVTMLFVLIAMVASVVASWVSENTLMIAVTIIMLVVTIIVVMMVIMYYFAYLASLTACRVNGDTGESYGKVSSYVAVLHIILGLLAIVELLSGIVNSEIAAIAAAVGKLGWMILFGVWMLMYKGRLENVED